MKVILSRKGFDSCAGGCASPIIDGKTLLSLPIPDKYITENDKQKIRYSDLNYNGINYRDLITNLRPKFDSEFCHLDPDIRSDIRSTVKEWIPAFGQTGNAQKVLKSVNVDIGDVFLFFGWFRGVEFKNEKYRYLTKRTGTNFASYANIHVIYGYMQIGEKIDDRNRIKHEFGNHPHSCDWYLNSDQNTIYRPSDSLSSLGLNDFPGYGTLDFAPERILTKVGCPRSYWENKPWLDNSKQLSNVHCRNIGNNCLTYIGQWQELVFDLDPSTIPSVRKIITG